MRVPRAAGRVHAGQPKLLPEPSQQRALILGITTAYNVSADTVAERAEQLCVLCALSSPWDAVAMLR